MYRQFAVTSRQQRSPQPAPDSRVQSEAGVMRVDLGWLQYVESLARKNSAQF
jgi:hypothetical protein